MSKYKVLVNCNIDGLGSCKVGDVVDITMSSINVSLVENGSLILVEEKDEPKQEAKAPKSKKTK